jgi:alkylation response protein AidB-like acyl-CoA dehydrogenase
MVRAESDVGLSEEQRAARDAVREFVRAEVAPTAREADESATFPEDVWDGLAALDLAGLTVPEAYGGYGADRTTYALVNEELARGSLAVATALSVHCLVTSSLAAFGSEAVRAEWLPDLVDGRPVGMFALSEPDAGSDPAAMTTTATREGDEYVIDGEKQWITNGERGGVAVVFAKTDPGDRDSVTQFLVPTDTPGVEVGEAETKLGLRASDTTALSFDGARVPADYRLTGEGRGLSAALSVLSGGRIGIAAQAVGLAAAALDAAREYVEDREGVGGPRSERQSVRHTVAEMATAVAAARALVRAAARAEDAGEDPRTLASMAKYRASETAVEVTGRAVQVHGVDGYTRAFDVERYYRDAKVTTIYEGTSEIQKEVIARDILG